MWPQCGGPILPTFSIRSGCAGVPICVCAQSLPGRLSPQSHVEFVTQMLPDDERAALDFSWAGQQTRGRALLRPSNCAGNIFYNQILEFKLSVATGKLR